MSRLGQQMFFARKRSANVAAAKGVHSVRKRSATKRQQQQDVGREGVITGRDGFSLRSSACSLQGLICDADPQGVAQPPLQSTIYRAYIKMSSTTFSNEPALFFLK
ncbi:hypothetical protein [Lysinibacillus xylanilyticus]|uniref:hypothetical protein n=1 Tax=Lysinibacillus xylanilyticus TaxID=582475 RepID=UPI003D01C07D